jgi:monoamine oxidase
MEHTRIVIVGAGLSGLYAAHLLERQGIRDIVLLEAREAVGGRIAGVHAPATSDMRAAIDRFDLGPTWFWPDHQRELHHLVNELGLQRFAQYDQGDMMVERAPGEAPVRTRGYVSAPQSMRLVGGMNALTDALPARLKNVRIVTGQAVRRMRSTANHVELDSEDTGGNVTTWYATHVLLALPPRLAASGIVFEPALPAPLTRQWKATATWMAPHAKYLAIYDTPFWRERGLSGSARSASGPMGEIHDASMPGGSAALFGFLGVPARTRLRLSGDALLAQCRAQLTHLFGPQAATPRTEIIKDWAQDRWTATTADLDAGGDHGQAPAAAASSGPWQGRLTGIASEWSPRFPGYVAGAIDAADLGVRAWTRQHGGAATPQPY